jgi:hypothetical protein
LLKATPLEYRSTSVVASCFNTSRPTEGGVDCSIQSARLPSAASPMMVSDTRSMSWFATVPCRKRSAVHS